jgi:hypothetical protein
MTKVCFRGNRAIPFTAVAVAIARCSSRLLTLAPAHADAIANAAEAMLTELAEVAQPDDDGRAANAGEQSGRRNSLPDEQASRVAVAARPKANWER